MTTRRPNLLKHLLTERHLQNYRTFCREYDRHAAAIDPSLVGTHPSRAQFHRWISGEISGLPYPDHCQVLESILPGNTAKELFSGSHQKNRQDGPSGKRGVSDDYLSSALAGGKPFLGSDDGQAELICTYPDRASVPRDVWLKLMSGATSGIDVLVFSGTFLAQTNPKLPQMLMDCAANGVRVRLCFGDPDGSAVALRDAEEGIDGTLGAKIRACLSYFPQLVGSENCDIRLHNHTMYASIFRYDDQAMINPHIWGSPASANPIFHFRRVGEDCTFSKYLDSFERVWEHSKPWYPKS